MYNPDNNTVMTTGICVDGMQCITIPMREKHGAPLCHAYEFLEYTSHNNCSSTNSSDETQKHSTDPENGRGSILCCMGDSITFCMDTAMENIRKLNINLISIGNSISEVSTVQDLSNMASAIQVNITAAIREVSEDISHLQDGKSPITIIKFDQSDARLMKAASESDICVVFSNMAKHLDSLGKLLPPHCWLVVLADSMTTFEEIESDGFSPVIMKSCSFRQVCLYHRTVINVDPLVVNVNEHVNFNWVYEIQKSLEKIKNDKMKRLWLVCDEDHNSGIIGMVKTLLLEPGGEQLR